MLVLGLFFHGGLFLSHNQVGGQSHGQQFARRARVVATVHHDGAENFLHGCGSLVVTEHSRAGNHTAQEPTGAVHAHEAGDALAGLTVRGEGGQAGQHLGTEHAGVDFDVAALGGDGLGQVVTDVVPDAGGARCGECLHLQGCAVAGDGCGDDGTGCVVGFEAQVHAVEQLDAQRAQVDVVFEVFGGDFFNVVGAVDAVVLNDLGRVLLFLQLLNLDVGLFDLFGDSLVDGGLFSLLGALLLTKSEHGIPTFTARRVRGGVLLFSRAVSR